MSGQYSDLGLDVRLVNCVVVITEHGVDLELASTLTPHMGVKGALVLRKNPKVALVTNAVDISCIPRVGVFTLIMMGLT